MNARIRRLNVIALGIALTYALFAIQFVKELKAISSQGTVQSGYIVSPAVDFLFIYVTSAGLYQVLVAGIQRLVESSTFLLRLYWGKLHVNGLWSYVYTIDGDASGEEYFGIWRFEQDLFGTSVVGYGLTKEFRERSRVRSLTDLVENNRQLEVVNVRTDSVAAGVEYYSRTTMFFEFDGRHIFRRPNRMSGQTFVFGGPLTGKICSNVFVRHADARTEQDVVRSLRENFRATGDVHGTPKPSILP